MLDSFDDVTCAKLAESPDTFHAAADKGHGRNEYRRVWVQREVDWLYNSEQWPGLKSLVLVESERMGALVRGHWHVENKLHWVLDVTFGEDRSKISRKNGAENLSLLRKIAINMLQNAPVRGRRNSIAGKKKLAVWRFDYLLTVLTSGNVED